MLILDRPRHQDLIAAVRKAGARIRLISDGDVAGVIATARPETGIDIYMGSGGAPEGVLAAAACAASAARSRASCSATTTSAARPRHGDHRSGSRLRLRTWRRAT